MSYECRAMLHAACDGPGCRCPCHEAPPLSAAQRDRLAVLTKPGVETVAKGRAAARPRPRRRRGRAVAA